MTERISALFHLLLLLLLLRLLLFFFFFFFRFFLFLLFFFFWLLFLQFTFFCLFISTPLRDFSGCKRFYPGTCIMDHASCFSEPTSPLCIFIRCWMLDVRCSTFIFSAFYTCLLTSALVSCFRNQRPLPISTNSPSPFWGGEGWGEGVISFCIFFFIPHARSHITYRFGSSLARLNEFFHLT